MSVAFLFNREQPHLFVYRIAKHLLIHQPATEITVAGFILSLLRGAVGVVEGHIGRSASIAKHSARGNVTERKKFYVSTSGPSHLLSGTIPPPSNSKRMVIANLFLQSLCLAHTNRKP